MSRARSVSQLVGANTALGNTTISGSLSVGNTTITGTANVTGITTFSNTVTIAANSAVVIPVGNTSQRPASPTNGMIRFNSDWNYLEFYQSSNWYLLSGISSSISVWDILGTTNNTNGNALNSAASGMLIYFDPADPLSYSGSGSSVSNRGFGGQTGSISGLSYTSAGAASYWDFPALGTTADISWGNSSTYWAGMTDNSSDSWAYCGWWRPNWEMDSADSNILWVLNDGDWSPANQVGVRWSQQSDGAERIKICSGNSGYFVDTAVPSATYTNTWTFIAVWHKLSGGIVVMQGLAGDANLTTVVDTSTSTSTYSAQAIPLTFGSRPDNRANEHCPQGTRMGPQMLWSTIVTNNNGALSTSQSDAKTMFESIFDRTKTRYV